MKTLYEVVLSNIDNGKRRSVLVLSHEPITEDNTNIKSIVGERVNEFIVKIQKPEIIINAWDESGFNELDRIKEQLI